MTLSKASLRFMVAAVAMTALAACSSTRGDSSATSGSGIGTAQSGPGSVMRGSQQDLVVNVGDRVFFATNSSGITSEARTILNRQAAWLKLHPRKTVTIEGHCDERGTREYNLALGSRRANSVRDYLVSLGVDPTRIRTIAYGKERPVALCANETCWSQNRRGVTVVNDRAGS